MEIAFSNGRRLIQSVKALKGEMIISAVRRKHVYLYFSQLASFGEFIESFMEFPTCRLPYGIQTHQSHCQDFSEACSGAYAALARHLFNSNHSSKRKELSLFYKRGDYGEESKEQVRIPIAGVAELDWKAERVDPFIPRWDSIKFIVSCQVCSSGAGLQTPAVCVPYRMS
ncbi:uncharacterized protein LOC143684830 [Tamandua tetradactyla]|uniref:uncharacterized protein LOC143684830 n=1 Tax=Tamandua tetradactyla TaxID=48850 RepID=UPI004053CA35